MTLSDGKTVAGTVTTVDGNFVVATPNAGTVTQPKDSVSKLFGEAQQAAYEKSLHPGLLEGWQGGANVGFGLTRGNSEIHESGSGFHRRPQDPERSPRPLHQQRLHDQ